MITFLKYGILGSLGKALRAATQESAAGHVATALETFDGAVAQGWSAAPARRKSILQKKNKNKHRKKKKKSIDNENTTYLST